MQTLFNQIRRMTLFEAALLASLLLLAAFLALPIVFIINHAFKPYNELFMFPPTFLVKEPTLSNFYDLFLRSSASVVPFSRYLFNSIIVTSISLVAVIVSCSMAAYVLSKYQFGLKKAVMAMIMLSLMFAPETVAIPRYLIISWLQINNTYFGHILPFIASPVAVFLMKQFVDQIPNELVEAAKVDGASELRIFLQIVMPLAMPALATIAIITFQSVWSDGQASTLFMQDETMKTLPYYITTLTSGANNTVAGQGMAAAAGLLMFLPNLIIFLFAQKRIMETMVHSGVK
ncbi:MULTISPECIES: carbohydrate ABC transporter permease [unclassified Paenibacillus]|uniref:carbohydrate ABC transporter permease n=1 Tax=unclassified Paenibacillus TaxID=185978 RepID=UPI00104B75AA|nr:MULTISPECIES: carbohydrate ABC transporter permease [unclassified Paenibacillus]NIK67244.1 ABC-type glycerol-3-phosphate transport system permease component [Paenibacillus sp. BK720]TCN01296.1 carbohydrate ABC transporter membrane protein 2 (CUT1 family) [Paenibacillus sp. BK033]